MPVSNLAVEIEGIMSEEAGTEPAEHEPIIEEYRRLNEKCDFVLKRIKQRKEQKENA